MQKWYCVQQEVLSSIHAYIPFPYSSCVSPASAFGRAGASASDRQPQKLERIWGDTDHQGNEATAGNTRVETRGESSDGPLLHFTKGSLSLSEKLPSWCPCCCLGFEVFLAFCFHADFFLVLPLLNSTAVLPVCPSPSLVTCCFLLLTPAHHSLSYCPFFLLLTCFSQLGHLLDFSALVLFHLGNQASRVHLL